MGLLHVFAAIMAVFPGRTSANPMKVHNVLFITFGAYALHFRLVAFYNHLDFVVGVFYCLLMLPKRVSFSRCHIQKTL